MWMSTLAGWYSIPYCILIAVAWFYYNKYWTDNDDSLVGFGGCLGAVWSIVTITASFSQDVVIRDPKLLLVMQFGPLIILSFFGTISLFKYLILNNKINYEYVIYSIPVLLSLTLFFL